MSDQKLCRYIGEEHGSTVLKQISHIKNFSPMRILSIVE